MVRTKSVLVSLIALLLGALATAFSFIAHAKRPKDVGIDPNILYGPCVYTSRTSSTLGIVAALFLLAEQILIGAGTHCFCCCGARFKAHCTLITSILFFIVSWIAFMIGFIGLIYASIFKNNNFFSKIYSGNAGGNCELEDENWFLGAAFWCIISTVLGLISYAFWGCGASDFKGNTNHERGVAIGELHVQQC